MENEKKSMRAIRLSDLVSLASYNFGSSDLAIIHLQEMFEDGKIQACKARKEYAKLRANWMIDCSRFARLKAAQTGSTKEKFFDSVRLEQYDDYFGV